MTNINIHGVTGVDVSKSELQHTDTHTYHLRRITIHTTKGDTEIYTYSREGDPIALTLDKPVFK